MSLLEFASRGDVAGIQNLIHHGHSVDQRSNDGSTALHIAARYGQEDVVNLLLQYNLNPNEQNSTGNTPLHMAVGYQHIPVVKKLLQKGALVAIPNKDGKTPEDYAPSPEVKSFLQNIAHIQATQQQQQTQQPAGQHYPSQQYPSYGSQSYASQPNYSSQQTSPQMNAQQLPAKTSPVMPSPTGSMSTSIYQSSQAPQSVSNPYGSVDSGTSSVVLSTEQLQRMEDERRKMNQRVREKFGALLKEKQALEEKNKNLEAQLSLLGNSENGNVEVLQAKVLQMENTIKQQQEQRVTLERRVKDKLAQMLEEKNTAIERMKSMEALHGGMGNDPKEAESVRERIAYLVDENDKYMAKITDLEGKLLTSKSSNMQVEQFYRQQQQANEQEKWALQQHVQKYQQFANQQSAAKQQLEGQVAALAERIKSFEAACSEMFSRLKTKEARIVELEAMVDVDNVGSKNLNNDMLHRVAELTGEVNTLKMEKQNVERELEVTANRCKEQETKITTLVEENTNLKDKTKTIEMENDRLKKRVDQLEKAVSKGGVSLDDEAKEEEVDPDVKAGTLVLVSSEGQASQIKGGTTEVLVKRLLIPKYTDPDYMPAFLLTYRTFMAPVELIDAVISYYTEEAPDSMSTDEKTKWVEEKQRPLRVGCYRMLKDWIEKFYDDFAKNEELTKKLQNFIEDMVSIQDVAFSKLGTQLKKIFEKKQANPNSTDDIVKNSIPPPKPLVDKKLVIGSVNFLDLHPLEVARHLSLIEFELFKKIRTNELMGQQWNKKNKDERAPHIVRMIKRFNEVGSWVTTEIVQHTDNLKTRIAVLEKFIKIAQHLRELNNFNGVMEIIAGLQSSSIFRLKKTWAGIKSRSQTKFEELRDLMSNRGSYKAFREALHHAEPPCLPYLGVYLTDLTFIEDGNQDFLNEDAGVISFSKRRKIANVIREIQQYQKTAFNFERVRAVDDYLVTRQGYDEDEAYNLSLQAEPRQSS